MNQSELQGIMCFAFIKKKPYMYYIVVVVVIVINVSHYLLFLHNHQANFKPKMAHNTSSLFKWRVKPSSKERTIA